MKLGVIVRGVLVRCWVEIKSLSAQQQTLKFGYRNVVMRLYSIIHHGRVGSKICIYLPWTEEAKRMSWFSIKVQCF